MIYFLFILVVMSCGYFSSRARKARFGLFHTLAFGFLYGLSAVALIIIYLYTSASPLLGVVNTDEGVDQAILLWSICFPFITAIYFLIDYVREKN